MAMLRKITGVVIIIIIIISLASGLFPSSLTSSAHAAESKQRVAYTKPVPQGNVGDARPIIGKKFELTGNPILLSYSLLIDGKPVEVKWDSDNPKFTFVPPTDLAVGVHKALLEYKFQGFQEGRDEWSFNVVSEIVRRLSEPTVYEQNAVTAINYYRRLLGLQTVEWNGRLAASANKHADYLIRNFPKDYEGTVPISHDEDPAKPGFFGKTGEDRAKYFGYPYFLGEINHPESNDPFLSDIDSLYDAPYHRMAFLHPDAKEVGPLRKDNFTVIEVGGAPEPHDEPVIIVSPASEQTSVPLAWLQNERPNPLRLYSDAKAKVGYPIVAVVHGTDLKKIEFVSARLTDAFNNNVDIYVNSPEKDNYLFNGMIIFPKQPLKPAAAYTVQLQVKVTQKDGGVQPLSRTWSFTTEPRENYAKTVRHSELSHTASFGLDDSYFYVDGAKIKMAVPVKIIDGSAYLYIRDLSKALGADVNWDGKQRAAVYEKGERRVVLYTAEKKYEMNGGTIQTDTPARLIDNYTMVPVRLLAEVLDSKVGYDAATRTVTITY